MGAGVVAVWYTGQGSGGGCLALSLFPLDLRLLARLASLELLREYEALGILVCGD